MTPRPYNPRAELDGALQRGHLRHAIRLAAEVAEDSRRPIDLELAFRFRPLVVAQQLDAYDGWACRWLARWLSETPGATID